jgi:hypothetical protein
MYTEHRWAAFSDPSKITGKELQVCKLKKNRRGTINRKNFPGKFWHT